MPADDNKNALRTVGRGVVRNIHLVAIVRRARNGCCIWMAMPFTYVVAFTGKSSVHASKKRLESLDASNEREAVPVGIRGERGQRVDDCLGTGVGVGADECGSYFYWKMFRAKAHHSSTCVPFDTD